MGGPKVTVYVPCHNYGRFLTEALESVARQSFPDWELLIIDDGSTDDTPEKARDFAARFAGRVRVLTHAEAKGLQASSNEALRHARGSYLMRLDADDFLDESALLVLSDYLDHHPDVALVYPNYLYVDEQGRTLGVEQRKRVSDGGQVLDLPAHGACTMIRKRVLKSLAGYDERFDRQDGYELWLKVLHRYGVANVSTPLFSYRQHGSSLTRDSDRLLNTRAEIKRQRASQYDGDVRPHAVGVIRAKNTYEQLPDIVLAPLADKPLLDYTLDAAAAVEALDLLVVTTDDPRVLEYCSERYPTARRILRPPELSEQSVTEHEVVEHAVAQLEKDGYYPDIVVSLNIHCPLRRASHIQEAIDTLLLYNLDTVISVYEDFELHYLHASHGLEPLNPAMHSKIRLERESLYVDNGAIRASWREALGARATMARAKVGHVVMPRWESLQIKSNWDRWLMSQIVTQSRPPVLETPGGTAL